MIDHMPRKDVELPPRTPEAAIIADLRAQLADAKAAQAMVAGEAAEAAGNAAVEALLRRKPEAGPLQIQMTRQNVRLPVLALADTDGFALVQSLRAERDALKTDLTSYMEAANEYMRGEEAATADRDRLAAANAALEAQVARLVGALEALQKQALQSSVNDPANEWGAEALEMTRAALAEVQADARREGGE